MKTDAKTLAGGWLAVLTDRLVREMEAEGIEEPLAESLTLAAVVADLFRLTETPMPASVAALVGGTA